MQENLAKLYEFLKSGSPDGILINSRFENYEYKTLKELYNRAINEGFAQDPRRIFYVGSPELVLALSDEGRKYPSFSVYQNRFQKSDFSISNSVVGDNNSGVIQGRDFLNNSSPTINTTPQHDQPKQKAPTMSHTFWDKVKYISVIVGGVSALIIGLGKILGWW
jgi:hypothetical protein